MKKKTKLQVYEVSLTKQVYKNLARNFKKKTENIIARKESLERTNQILYSTVIAHLAGAQLMVNQLKALRDKAIKSVPITELELQKAKLKTEKVKNTLKDTQLN